MSNSKKKKYYWYLQLFNKDSKNKSMNWKKDQNKIFLSV